MESLPKQVAAHILSVVGPDETIIDVYHPTPELATKRARQSYIAFVNPFALLLAPFIIYGAEFERQKLGNTYYVVTDEAIYTIVLDMDKRGKWVVTNGNSLSRLPYEQVVLASVDTPGQGCTCMQIQHAFVQTSGIANRYDEFSDTNVVQPAGEWMLVEDPHAMVVQINNAMRACKKRDRAVEVHTEVTMVQTGSKEKRVFVSSLRTPDDVRVATIRTDMDIPAVRLAVSEALDLPEQNCSVQLMYAPGQFSVVTRAENIRDNDRLVLAEV
ncbi:hypothetical protein FVE85_3723 [Porphyridium purpureum]|uniref:Uncharacterized protein n=1 Tax=Porphyridium purpureum TaxID=35688 RepID=A0A5J4YMB0_PORPP|nr:hypothetical protein FVE85_3723 [Porphyridium purpureum]|eukprot:POR0079..scf249_10